MCRFFWIISLRSIFWFEIFKNRKSRKIGFTNFQKIGLTFGMFLSWKKILLLDEMAKINVKSRFVKCFKLLKYFFPVVVVVAVVVAVVAVSLNHFAPLPLFWKWPICKHSQVNTFDFNLNSLIGKQLWIS